jgi:hypothetical protein
MATAEVSRVARTMRDVDGEVGGDEFSLGGLGG